MVVGLREAEIVLLQNVQRKENIMFNHVTNLAQTRSHIEAVGFFLFYTVLLVGLSTFLGHYLVTLGVIDGTVGSFFEGGTIHTLIGAGWTLVISSMILSSKKLTSDIMAVVIALVGVYLAYTVNVMLGMVVVAYLTTLGK
jgi:hypothetical protein